MFEKLKLKKKVKQLQKEANNGNTQAMYDLAIIYLENPLVKANKQEADMLMNNAAEQGHLAAKAYLTANKISKGVNIISKAVTEIKNLK